MNEKQAQEMCSRVTFEDLCVMPAAVVNQVEWHLQALQGFCLLAGKREMTSTCSFEAARWKKRR